MVRKNNEAEWFYGRNANNFWKYIPEAMINSSLKGLKKEDWIKFCKKNEVVIIDLVKTFNSNQELNSFSDKEVEFLIGIIIILFVFGINIRDFFFFDKSYLFS